MTSTNYAEQTFLKRCKEKGYQFERFGFDRANIPPADFARLPPKIRHQPDFIITKPFDALIEVKSTPKEGGGFKLKKADWEPLRLWNDELLTVIFVDNPAERWAKRPSIGLLSIDKLSHFNLDKEFETFMLKERRGPDKPAWLIPWELVTVGKF